MIVKNRRAVPIVILLALSSCGHSSCGDEKKTEEVEAGRLVYGTTVEVVLSPSISGGKQQDDALGPLWLKLTDLVECSEQSFLYPEIQVGIATNGHGYVWVYPQRSVKDSRAGDYVKDLERQLIRQGTGHELARQMNHLKGIRPSDDAFRESIRGASKVLQEKAGVAASAELLSRAFRDLSPDRSVIVFSVGDAKALAHQRWQRIASKFKRKAPFVSGDVEKIAAELKRLGCERLKVPAENDTAAKDNSAIILVDSDGTLESESVDGGVSADGGVADSVAGGASASKGIDIHDLPPAVKSASPIASVLLPSVKLPPTTGSGKRSNEAPSAPPTVLPPPPAPPFTPAPAGTFQMPPVKKGS